MSKFGIQDHDIYKKRGKMNMQIGLVLGAIVLLIMIASMAKLATTLSKHEETKAQPAVVETQNDH